MSKYQPTPTDRGEAYTIATALAQLVARANAQAESSNETIRILFPVAKKLGYDMAGSYTWDPDTFLPTKGTGLILREGVTAGETPPAINDAIEHIKAVQEMIAVLHERTDLDVHDVLEHLRDALCDLGDCE